MIINAYLSAQNEAIIVGIARCGFNWDKIVFIDELKKKKENIFQIKNGWITFTNSDFMCFKGERVRFQVQMNADRFCQQ